MPPEVVRIPVQIRQMLSDRALLLIGLGVLFVSALPDAMAVPVLKELLVTRYGVSEAYAPHFLSVNLLGGALAVPLLARLRKRFAPARMLAVAAIADSALLLVMAAPIGFGPTLIVRAVEGMADLIVYAVIFDLVGKCGPHHTRARRLGLASMGLMLGLCAGMMAGGRIGTANPIAVFPAGALLNLLVIVLVLSGFRSLNQLVQSCPIVSDDGSIMLTRKPIWPALAMVFSDRAIPGMMLAILPFFLGEVCGFTPAQRGVLIGLPIAVIGFGAWGAGWIADRFGSARVRWWSALAYAAAIGMLPLAAVTGFQVALLASVLLGLAGAALLPTSLNLAMATGRGSVGMGLHRTAGDLGYLFGILAAAGSLALLKSWVDPTSAYPAVITTFAGFHACTTGAILFLTSR